LIATEYSNPHQSWFWRNFGQHITTNEPFVTCMGIYIAMPDRDQYGLDTGYGARGARLGQGRNGRKIKMKLTTALVAAVALCAGASPAIAQQDTDAWDPWEKWSISAGAFIVNFDNTVQIGGPNGGFEFDVESALGLRESRTVFRLDGGYRFGSDNRHRIDITWFDLARDATKTLEEEIEIDGIIYPISTTVNSEFELAFYNFRYAYSFIKDDRIDFAGSLGLHITRIGLFVSDTENLIGAGGDAVTAPLPVLGVRLDVALTPRWYVRSSVEALYLSFGNYTGSITDVLLAGEYRGWEHFALGIGLNTVRVEVENDNSFDLNFNGKASSDFVGLMLYGRVMF